MAKKEKQNISPVVVVAAAGLIVYAVEKLTKKNPAVELAKMRVQSLVDLNAILSNDRMLCENLSTALSDPNSYESQSDPDTKCGFEWQKQYNCRFAERTAQKYVNDAETLARYLGTHIEFSWYNISETWTEDDLGTFRLLKDNYQTERDIQMLNLHYTKISGGRDLYSDIYSLLNDEYLTQLNFPNENQLYSTYISNNC